MGETIFYGVLGLAAAYVLARIIFAAYFKAKADYNRRFFTNGDDN